MWSRLRIIRRRFERNEFFRRPPGIFERGRLKVLKTVPTVEHQAETDAALFVVIVNQALAVTVKAAHHSLKFALDGESVGHLRRAIAAFRVVAQSGRKIMFVVQAVLQFDVAITQIFG